MPSLLIDSHVLIWLIYQPERIGLQAKQAIEQAEEVYISAVSLWELALKHSKNKLSYTPAEISGGANALNLARLQIEDQHIAGLKNLNLPHSDPFDNMITAQAIAEDLTIVTIDQNILRSGCSVLDVSK